MTAKPTFNAEHERKQLRTLVRRLEVYDAEVQAIPPDPPDTLEPQQATLHERIRDATAQDLLKLLLLPDYSFVDAFRQSMYETVSIADNAVTLNVEAEDFIKKFPFQMHGEIVTSVWDANAFGELLTNLTLVRQAYFLARVMLTPELAERVATHMVDRLFGRRVQPPQQIQENTPHG